MAWPFCDVCLVGDAISVNCSAVGPMSNAYCTRCHQELAEPEWSFHYLYDGVADGDIEAIASWCRDLKTFKEDRYWTLEEWFEWRHFQWFTPDPYFHWWAFEPNGPLKDTQTSPYPGETDESFDTFA